MEHCDSQNEFGENQSAYRGQRCTTDDFNKLTQYASEAFQWSQMIDLSYFGAWLVLINCMLGASVVALPYVVKICGGIAQYFGLLSGSVIANLITMTVYARLADETGSRFAYELCERVVKSNTLANLYIVGFIFKAYTVLLVSITFFADQLEIFLELIIGSSAYDEKRNFYRFLSVLACVILSIPFLIPKKVNMLQIPGMLTCFSSCSIVILTLFIYTEHKIDKENAPTAKQELVNNEATLWDFLGAVPILVLGLGAHEMSIICYDSIGEKKQLSQWYKVIAGLYVFAFSAFMVVGVLGYVTFGDEVKDDFLLNCSPDSVIACIGKFLSP
ncbi:sodium-coupled neutral amino acid transporter 7-like [Convolutriloba macropyga]|uniref:sodium-coupled neutral amino acid transporter 7-like n=1 Tax=Convolutriloba macropyga TaxID=536237 RepID=UPI003F525E7A